MTATTTSSRSTTPAAQVPVAPLGRRRSSRLLWLGVGLVVAGALLGWLVYSQAGQRVAVVALARPVPYGHTVSEADVRVVWLPADAGLATVAWTERGGVLNRPAATELAAGQLVTPDSVLPTRLPEAGQAIVGVALKRGQLPATSLAPRDAVWVVAAGSPGGGGQGVSAEPVGATVLRAGEVDGSGARLVDLLVADEQAVEVARLAGAGQAALVVVPRR